jgi:UDP-N-acetyl-D-glucosamine dehydrogenase
VTYKKYNSDVRESPAVEILEHLMRMGAEVSYSDPYAPALTVGDHRLTARRLDAEVLEQCELAIVVTDHSAFDYPWLAAHAPLVLDTRNAMAAIRADHVRKL